MLIRKTVPALTSAAVMILSLSFPLIQAAAEQKTFTVGFDAEFPPYGYKDESGEYVGFDLSLAQEVCNRRGWELKKVPIDWNSKDMELKTGSIDCIWNGFTMNGRENDYTWSTPYVDNSQVVIVKADSDINELADLSGKTVAVQADSSALAAFTGEDAEPENIELAESFKSLQQVGDYNSAFMNLESGAVNAICMDIGVANYELDARGGKFVMLDEHVSSEQYGVGFLKGNTGKIDKGIGCPLPVQFLFCINICTFQNTEILECIQRGSTACRINTGLLSDFFQPFSQCVHLMRAGTAPSCKQSRTHKNQYTTPACPRHWS